MSQQNEQAKLIKFIYYLFGDQLKISSWSIVAPFTSTHTQYFEPHKKNLQLYLQSGNLTITLNAGNVNRNFKILVQNGNYHIGWRTFRSIEDLIEHYRRHYIYTTEQERSSLTRPFVHPGLISLPDSLVPNYTGLLYSPAFRAYETVFNEHWEHTRQASTQ
ncbi:uncharacterized protein DEA37_0009895 [Paragonimus westermani]|uniref:SH2 domain-containing protein n=1 Tax=Paragonimus westermani TaxID=34504 RepID=A0A5J4NN09_9TREM|nr:uncharacterized protein DEA37_0009895 [Paragonimus westermani]